MAGVSAAKNRTSALSGVGISLVLGCFILMLSPGIKSNAASTKPSATISPDNTHCIAQLILRDRGDNGSCI